MITKREHTSTTTIANSRRSAGRRWWRPAFVAACACTGLLSILVAGPAAAAAAKCENHAIREQQGAAALALPECRAYEMVSPLGSSPEVGRQGTADVAAAESDRFAYKSLNPYPGDPSSGLYLLSSRAEHGWTTRPVTPPQGGLMESTAIACENASIYYSTELDSGVLSDGWREVEEYEGRVAEGSAPRICDGDVPPLVEGEPRGVNNLFMRDNETGKYTSLIDRAPLGGMAAENAYLLDATPDLRNVVFAESQLAPLTTGAPGGEEVKAYDLYEWTEGTLRLVSVRPGGQGMTGQLANGPTDLQGTAALTHAVSSGGERVFFYNNAAEALYVRVNAMREQSQVVSGECTEPAKACTLQVDKAQEGAEGPGGGGIFLDASANGQRVFFADDRRLTKDATAEPEKPDIYEYDVETGELHDLTVDTEKSADVIGYAGAGEEGSYVYFVAHGKLTREEQNSQGEAAVAGQPNLYVRHGATTRFVARLEPPTGAICSPCDWRAVNASSTADFVTKTAKYLVETTRVSPNGRYAAFNVSQQIYLYDARANTLTCASCVSAGVAAGSSAKLRLPASALQYAGPVVAPRNLLDDGSLFFDSRTSEGSERVYEYREGGAKLLAPGGAVFLGASANGVNVLFATGQALLRGDTDSAPSVYDARKNGGFPEVAPEEVVPCTSVEGCRSPLTVPPGPVAPGSPTFVGAGNVSPASPLPSNGKKGGGEAKHGLTRKQKLKRALKHCREKKGRHRRRGCKRRVRERFGAYRHYARHSKRRGAHHSQHQKVRVHGRHRKTGGAR